jgi:hypothetical protein
MPGYPYAERVPEPWTHGGEEGRTSATGTVSIETGAGPSPL